LAAFLFKVPFQPYSTVKKHWNPVAYSTFKISSGASRRSRALLDFSGAEANACSNVHF